MLSLFSIIFSLFYISACLGSLGFVHYLFSNCFCELSRLNLCIFGSCIFCYGSSFLNLLNGFFNLCSYYFFGLGSRLCSLLSFRLSFLCLSLCLSCFFLSGLLCSSLFCLCSLLCSSLINGSLCLFNHSSLINHCNLFISGSFYAFRLFSNCFCGLCFLDFFCLCSFCCINNVICLFLIREINHARFYNFLCFSLFFSCESLCRNGLFNGVSYITFIINNLVSLSVFKSNMFSFSLNFFSLESFCCVNNCTFSLLRLERGCGRTNLIGSIRDTTCDNKVGINFCINTRNDSLNGLSATGELNNSTMFGALNVTFSLSRFNYLIIGNSIIFRCCSVSISLLNFSKLALNFIKIILNEVIITVAVCCLIYIFIDSRCSYLNIGCKYVINLIRYCSSNLLDTGNNLGSCRILTDTIDKRNSNDCAINIYIIVFCLFSRLLRCFFSLLCSSLCLFSSALGLSCFSFCLLRFLLGSLLSFSLSLLCLSLGLSCLFLSSLLCSSFFFLSSLLLSSLINGSLCLFSYRRGFNSLSLNAFNYGSCYLFSLGSLYLLGNGFFNCKSGILNLCRLCYCGFYCINISNNSHNGICFFNRCIVIGILLINYLSGIEVLKDKWSVRTDACHSGNTQSALSIFVKTCEVICCICGIICGAYSIGYSFFRLNFNSVSGRSNSRFINLVCLCI